MSELWAALAGAMVGGFLTFLGAVVLSRIDTNEARRRLASALLAEGKAGRERYWEVFGKQVQALKSGEPWNAIGAIVTTQNFLSVYDGNTDKLGLLKSEDIDIIVRAATLTKAHIESINISSRNISELSRLMHELMHGGDVVAAQNVERMRDEARVNAGQALREESIRLIDAIDKAIAALEKYTKQ